MLRALILILLAFGVILGLVSKRKVAKIIGGMIFIPMLLMLAWGLVVDLWAHLSVLEKLGVVAGAMVLLLSWIVFFTAFGREVLASIVGDFIYDKLKSLFGKRRQQR